MTSKQKRIQSILKQLYGMHQQLFGQKYGIGMALDKTSEFNGIIQEFRTVIFVVRASQQERQVRQNKKNYIRTPQKLKLNQQIRQDLVRAENILTEAAKRVNSGDIDQNVRKNRQKTLQNCYNLLQDAKQVEQGGTYMPPSHPTFQEIRSKLLQQKKLRHQDDSDAVDLQEEMAFDKFDEKDKQMDNVLDNIIDGDRKVRNKMQEANKKIDESKQKINKNREKMQELTTRVLKADSDLAQLVKKYQRPSQCCLNVTLVFLVLALIGVIISLIRGQTV